MNADRSSIFWIAVLVVCALALWLVKDILLPFAAGIALAYMQAPLAGRLERLGINRVAAALLIVTVVLLALILPAVLLAPVLSEQAIASLAGIPSAASRLQAALAGLSPPWLQQILGADANRTPAELMAQATGHLSGFLDSMWSGGKAALSFISVALVTPVVTFYLICGWPRMIDTLYNWVPPRNRDGVRRIVGEIDNAISSFLRGQVAICLLVAIYFAVTLSLVGLKFALLIGLVNGVLSFIPYVGPTIGMIIGVGVAVEQFWPQWTPIAIVVAIFLIGQFIAGYVLGPKLIGANVGLPPVWLIFAMLGFGCLFGFFGLLIAVPLGAAIAILFRAALAHYLESPIYMGEKSSRAQTRPIAPGSSADFR
jgi:predicted PurR-regulated permease PerM